MRFLRPLTLLALAAVLSGCFQTKTLIRLNADGSGTVEETVLMNSTMAMTVMMGGLNLFAEEEEEAAEMPDGPYTMEALQERAAEMGATLAGVEPLDVLFGAGYTATYAFADINDLRLSSDPSDGFPSDMGGEMGMGEDDEASGADVPITFAYQQGRLSIHMPRPNSAETDEEMAEVEIGDEVDAEMDEDDASGGPSQKDIQQMTLMLKDMRFSLQVELPGAITETNASHASGQTLTLFDMDLGVVAETPGAFDRLEALGLDGPPDLSAGAMAAFPQIPGFTFEPAEEVTVSFE